MLYNKPQSCQNWKQNNKNFNERIKHGDKLL